MFIIQAKHMISVNWKNVDGPRIGRWIEEIASKMIMEKIKYFIDRKKKESQE